MSEAKVVKEVEFVGEHYQVVDKIYIPKVFTDIEDHCIAVGRRVKHLPGERFEYATWEYSKAGKYYWGHYDFTEGAAYIDAYKRALKIMGVNAYDNNSKN